MNPLFLSPDLLSVEILRYRSMYDCLRSFAGGVFIWPYLRYSGLSLLHSFRWRLRCATLSYLIRLFDSGQTLGSTMLFDHQEQYCTYLVCVCICACALTCAGGQKRVLVFSPGVELQGCESHDIVAGDGTSQPLQVRQLSLAAEPSPAFSLPSVVLICISLVSSVAEHLSTHGCPCCVLHRIACSYRRSFLNRITLSFC